MKELFLLSGLGADKRVFEFLDLSTFKLNYIEWVEPIRNEPIEAYAKRLLPQITKANPIILGVSFGGMMAIEIGKLIPTEKIILISSAKAQTEIPFYYQLIGRTGIHKLVPPQLLKHMPFANWFFGTQNEDERKLLKSFIHDTDKKFLAWAIDKIVRWRNKTILSNIIHIHGTNDRLLPSKKADHLIKGAGHFMIVNRAPEISKIIR